MDLADARALWDPEPGWLNTASYGLPPAPAWRRAAAGAGRLAARRARRWEGWDESTERARRGVRPARRRRRRRRVRRRAGLPAARPGRGRPAGKGRVVVPDRSSPRTCSRGWCTRTAGSRSHRPDRPAARRDHGRAPTLVAFSLVQSVDRRGRRTGRGRGGGPAQSMRSSSSTRSQAVGWLPIDAREVDAFACVGYKWLMSPRGSAFLRAVRAAAASGCGRSPPAGTPARTSTRRTTARRCGWPPTPAASTSHRPGSAGWAPLPPSN